MKAKVWSMILFTTAFSMPVMAQGPSDALRFSQVFNGGTARFVGMGGAFGALGGDFGSLSYNPGGLGIFRSSEFTVTPSFKTRSISSSYMGNSFDDSRTRFYFDNVGFVLSFKPVAEADKGLVGLNLGFGYNRGNDFFANSFINGDNDVNSIMDYFANKANNGNYHYSDLTKTSTYNPFISSNASWDALLAWNTFLIDIDPSGDGTDYWASLNAGDGVSQENSVSSTGSSGEFVTSIGANFSNKFFLGASLGIQNFSYANFTTYRESAFSTNDTLSNGDRFYSLNYQQNFETSGTGYNLKIGAIYLPFEGFRLGLALHTPTYFNLHDVFSSTMSTDFEYGVSKSSTPIGKYDYNFETPVRTIASVAYVFKEIGLISFDYEYLDYSSGRFRDGGDGYSYVDENRQIASTFQNASNIRVGGEVKLNTTYVRAGYALYGSPYKSGLLNENSKTTILSGGVGYRSGNLIIDIAYLRTLRNEKYVFYDYPNITPVTTDMSEGKLLVTLGFKF